MKRICHSYALAIFIGGATLFSCQTNREQNDAAGRDHQPDETALVWVQGPAGKLCVSDEGQDGLPIVFVHSLAGEWQQWLSQLSHVRKNRRGIAFDLRGHGRSDPDDAGHYDITHWAEDLSAVVDTLGVQRFVLVGHSLGGGIVAAYAGAHPGRVAGLLLVDPIGDQRRAPKEAVQAFFRVLESDQYDTAIEGYWQQILINADETAKQLVLSALRKTPPAAVISGFKSTLTFDIVSALEAYTGPKLMVFSDLNRTPYSLQNILPSVPAIQVSGTGHWLQMDRPAEFNAILDRFLQEHHL